MEWERFISFIGMFVLLGIAWLMSNNKSKIRPRIIFWGVGLQLLFALIVLGERTYSLVGMFILHSMILIFIFTAEIIKSGGLARQIITSAVIVVIAGAFGALSFLLDIIGLAVPILLLSTLVIGWTFYKKNNRLQRYSVALFFL